MGRSYKVVCHEFAKRTTISGIYFIDKYKSKWIKLIWFGIFWILVALTVWQSVVCLRNFSANPTVIYIKIKRDHDIQFPAITFCTTNPFMRHKVENTESPIKDVMKKFEQALRNDEISSQTRRKRQDENDECPPMWMHTEIGCIYFSNASAMPYAYAKDYCEKLGGHLPIFLTLNDFEKFQNWWKVLNMSTSLFLGLHYNGAIGSWQWINGCKFQPYPNFWASYPSLWWRASVKYDQRGAESRGYLQFIPICQIMLNRTQTTTCPPFPATSTEMRPIFYECTKNWWCPTNSSQLVDNSYANTYCFCMLFTSEPANSNEKCKSIGSILSKGESRLKHLKFLMDQTKKDNEVNSTLCPPDFVYFNKSCFYYEYWWPTYRIFAKMVCESKYNSRLASIHSMDELWLLYNMMDRKGYNTPAVWIGGYRENVYSDNWQWHDDTPYDYQGPWSTWPYGPQPNHEYYLCFTPQDGNLHDAVAMIFNYVCRAEFSALTDETAEPENVPDNYTVCYKTKRNCDSSWVRFDDDCFYFTETNQNFEDARQACKALNADLPVFKDITVYKRFLHFWISNNYSESFWVGLIYIRSWQWINTCAYLNYPNFWNVSAIFNHSTFNFNYAVMYKNGLMEPITKTNKANVICHMTDNTDCGVLPAANSKLDPHYFLCTDKKWWCPDTRPSIPVSVPVGKCYCNVFGTDTCASVKTFTASQDTFGDMLTRLVADNAVYMRLCPPEFTYFNQTCLFVSKEKMNLTTAKAYCSNHYGSNLSTVHSVEEQWFLYKSLLLISNDETDLLINGVKKSGVFTWLDNSPFDYNPTWSSTGAGTLLNKPFKDSLYLTIKNVDGNLNDPVISTYEQVYFACRKEIFSIEMLHNTVQLDSFDLFDFSTLKIESGLQLKLNSIICSNEELLETQMHYVSANEDQYDGEGNTSIAVSSLMTETHSNIEKTITSTTTTTTITTTTAAPQKAEEPFSLKPLPAGHMSLISEFQEEVLYAAAAMEPEQASSLSYSLPDLLTYCSFNGSRCSMDNFIKRYYPGVGNCFSYNTMPPYKTVSRMVQKFGLKLILVLNSTDYLQTSLSPGFILSIHDNEEIVFPDSYHLGVTCGSSNIISLSKVNALVHFNCIQDVVNYTVEGCQRKCKQDIILSVCGCSDPTLPIEDYTTACDIAKKKCIDDVKMNSSYEAAEKMCKCDSPCFSDFYTYVHSRSTLTNHFPLNKTEYTNFLNTAKPTNVLQLEIYFRTSTYMAFDEVGSYQFVNLMTDLSNWFGLFLGFSILTCFEIVAFITSLILVSRKNQ